MATLIPEGQVTSSIYSMIKEKQYQDAILLLEEYRQSFTKSRAVLSLLGYCYYAHGVFASASECYAELTKLYPEVDLYQLYHAQALYKSCQYDEAMDVVRLIDSPELAPSAVKLKAAIKYGQEDFAASRGFLEECQQTDFDTMNNEACVLFAEGETKKALDKFFELFQINGFKADVVYNIALCHYSLKQYPVALKFIADIIERGIREHPELNVGMATEGIEVQSVGNTQTLAETAFIEAFNLKAAIEFQLKNMQQAQEALTDMPPRNEEELDSVTLHNVALIGMDKDANSGFEKLQFLLQQNPCPPETFGNLLLLYCKYEHYDLAADIMAENFDLTYKLLTPFVYDYLDATITRQTSPEEGFRKFDQMGEAHTETLRKLTKQVQRARHHNDDEEVKKTVNEYDEALETYIPVIMAQAKIYWDLKNYTQVEKIFRKSVEFCNEHDTWKLNVAHVLFMQSVTSQAVGQELKYKEAIGFYEPIVKKSYDNILDVSPIVLANLCVAYIMTSENEQAEELMRKIEKEEENIAYDEPDRKVFHLCIVNLVIGTLYCAKGNFQFGISRVIKSLEPFNKKLGTETWFYAKRCFCALIENMAKHIIQIQDNVSDDIVEFFEHAELHGRNIQTSDELSLNKEAFQEGRATVTYEARLLKSVFLRLL
eukprot:m.49308 g.49308  ORF g.49308 m.49308 type:complete len:656 (+) comp10609_c0_seq3:202-2169(+)